MGTAHYWRVIRPNQWIKNGVVMAALVFSQDLFVPSQLLRSLAAMAVFCVISSAIYVFNDIMDREGDSRHPIKRNRPVASGDLSEGKAGILAFFLLAAGLAFSFPLGLGFFSTVLAFVVAQTAYSVFLKNVVLLDVLTIALGFVMRAVAGAAAIDVSISPWLILCTLLVALFLGFAKRRHELILLGENASGHRFILGEYTVPLLDQLISIVTAATIVAYSIYTLSPEVTERFGNPYMILTLPLVIYGVFRYLYLVHGKEGGGNPSKILFNDGPLLLSVFLWGSVSVIVIYFL